MRLLAVLTVMAGFALTACAPSSQPDSSGRGAPAQLIYAPPGTGIVLGNMANGSASETRITASAPIGMRGTFTRDDGQQGSFYPGCWGCGGTMQIEEALYAPLWPLETGKEVSFLRTAQDGQKARVVISVEGTETIETPAGSFDTYVLVGRVQHLSGPTYTANVRAWWAPDPGWVVKAEGGDSKGSNLSSQVIEFSRR